VRRLNKIKNLAGSTCPYFHKIRGTLVALCTVVALCTINVFLQTVDKNGHVDKYWKKTIIIIKKLDYFMH
jgi:hypothetical protein